MTRIEMAFEGAKQLSLAIHTFIQAIKADWDTECRRQNVIQNIRGYWFYATKRKFITSLQIRFKPKRFKCFLLQRSVVHVPTKFWINFTKIMITGIKMDHKIDTRALLCDNIKNNYIMQLTNLAVQFRAGFLNLWATEEFLKGHVPSLHCTVIGFALD